MRISRTQTETSAFNHANEAMKVLSRCHAVLGNEFILGMIASFIRQPSLLSLLTVSSSTFRIALKILWATLPSAFYILRLLPSLTRTNGEWSVPNQKRPVENWEWARFDVYAPYIQHISSMFSSTVVGEPDIHRDVFARIAHSRQGAGPLFPLLRSLELSNVQLPTGLYDRPTIKHFLSPQLSDVSIESYSNLLEYVSELLTLSPMLTRLSLRGILQPTLFQLLPNFAQLKQLEIQATTLNSLMVPATFMNTLDHFSHLTHLNLRTTLPDRPSVDFPPHLQSLEFSGLAASMIRILGSGKFKSVVLRFEEQEAMASYSACFDALASGSSDTLVTLSVLSETYNRHDFHVIPCMEGLLSAPNLRALSVIPRSGMYIQLDDASVERMVHAWPKLRRVVLLSSGWYHGGDPHLHHCPSMRGVRDFITLQDLEHLSLMTQDFELTIDVPIPDQHSSLPPRMLSYLQWLRERYVE